VAIKTKYKGVYYDETHNTYYVNTTFRTEEGHAIKKCKRGFATAKKAYDWKNTYAVEVRTSASTSKKGKLDFILIKYIEYRRNTLKPTSLKRIKLTLQNHFLANVPSNIEQLKINHIFSLYEYVCGLPNKTSGKNLIISVFNTFVEWLDLTEQISSSFAKKFKVVFVPLKNTEETNNSFMVLEEYVDFINTFDKSNKLDKMYMLLFNVLFFTGARIGEVLALEFDDVDFVNGTIHYNKQLQEIAQLENVPHNSIKVGANAIVPYTKTNTVKTVSIPDWLLNDIEEWKELQTESPYIFYIGTRNSKIIHKTSVRKIFKAHLKLAGLPIIKIHDLRHSHTTMLYDSGCDSKYVAERLGHSSERTSKDIYNHLTRARKRVNDEIIKGFKIS
jgi:integrase